MKDITLSGLTDTGAFVDIFYTSDPTSLNYKDISTLEGESRIKQSVIKCLLSERGREPFIGYGSGMKDYINNGTYNITDPRTLAKIKDDMIQSLSYLVKIETSTDADEQIKEIKSLKMTVSGSTITISMELILQSGKELSFTITEQL